MSRAPAVLAALTFTLGLTACGTSGGGGGASPTGITSTALLQAANTAQTVCMSDWATQTCSDSITAVQTADQDYQQALNGGATDTAQETDNIAKARKAADSIAPALQAQQKASAANDTQAFNDAYQQFQAATLTLYGI